MPAQQNAKPALEVRLFATSTNVAASAVGTQVFVRASTTKISRDDEALHLTLTEGTDIRRPRASRENPGLAVFSGQKAVESGREAFKRSMLNLGWTTTPPCPAAEGEPAASRDDRLGGPHVQT